MPLDANHGLNALWASLLVEECLRQGVDYFCLSPGSRSTPLTVAVARHPQARRIVCLDERAAAFHAVGYARATGRPAVLICTSGTALANYLPAVIEAESDRLPLLICSADRPPELRDAGANQTIRQPGMLAPYVRWQHDLPCPAPDLPAAMALTTVGQALYQAQRSPAGPVHLNWMFREPLVPQPQTVPPATLHGLEAWSAGAAPFTRFHPPQLTPPAASIKRLIEVVNSARQGLVMVGNLHTADERAAARRLIERLGWPTAADITSGLRLGTHAPIIPYFDQVLLANVPPPDTALHIGGAVVSKRYLEYITRSRPARHLLVARHPYRHDPTHSLTDRLEVDLPALVDALPPDWQPARESAWLAGWQRASVVVAHRLATLVDDLGEMAVARLVTRHIRPDAALFLGNSMPVRDFDMYAAAEGPAVPVAANRGASGIDGNLASAAGLAVGLARPVTAVVGDLTALHDLNSLWLLQTIPQPVTVILLNNQGGGIFSFLPIRDLADVFEPYFGAPHPLTFEQLAAGFGLPYFQPTTPDAFRQAYSAAQQLHRPAVIEVRSDRAANWQAHHNLQAELRRLVNEATPWEQPA